MRVPTFAVGLALLALPLVLIGMTLTRGNVPERSFWTPYAELNWSAIEHHDMQIHVHPGLGDEEYNPHETVDRRRFDVLLGQSIYTRIDSHPGDRGFFDEVVHLLGPDRPIWLYAEDDMHGERTLGWNRNVILLEDFRPGSLHPDLPDGSAPGREGCLGERRLLRMEALEAAQPPLLQPHRRPGGGWVSGPERG